MTSLLSQRRSLMYGAVGWADGDDDDEPVLQDTTSSVDPPDQNISMSIQPILQDTTSSVDAGARPTLVPVPVPVPVSVLVPIPGSIGTPRYGGKGGVIAMICHGQVVRAVNLKMLL